jgi:hypothetical protein
VIENRNIQIASLDNRCFAGELRLLVLDLRKWRGSFCPKVWKC